jgi:hypothetical protein
MAGGNEANALTRAGGGFVLQRNQGTPDQTWQI